VATVIANFDTFAVSFDRKQIAVDSFMAYHKLPPTLQERVRRYHDFSWDKYRGADPTVALETVPFSLRLEMKLQMCGQIIKTTPLLQASEDTVIVRLVNALHFEHFPQFEIVFQVGESR
jgi:hypothetical protein